MESVAACPDARGVWCTRARARLAGTSSHAARPWAYRAGLAAIAGPIIGGMLVTWLGGGGAGQQVANGPQREVTWITWKGPRVPEIDSDTIPFRIDRTGARRQLIRTTQI